MGQKQKTPPMTLKFKGGALTQEMCVSIFWFLTMKIRHCADGYKKKMKETVEIAAFTLSNIAG